MAGAASGSFDRRSGTHCPPPEDTPGTDATGFTTYGPSLFDGAPQMLRDAAACRLSSRNMSEGH